MRYARKIFIVGFAVLMMFPQFLKAYAYDDADAYGGRGYVFGEYEKDEIIEKSEKDEKDKKDEKDETADEYGEGPDKDVTATETVYVSSPEEMNEAIENAGSENITAIILESDIDYGKMGSGAELDSTKRICSANFPRKSLVVCFINASAEGTSESDVTP